MPEKKTRDRMSMEGLVSIIMPNYNCERYVGNTIQSVLDQTYSDWELLFVDDCSTDNSVEIVKQFNDPRIRVLQNEKNSGAAVSRNLALREAKGRWIAFLDSDDLWLPNKLEKQLSFMQKNGHAFSFTDYEIIGADEKKQPYIFTGPQMVNRRRLYNYCYFSTITVIYDRQRIGLIQGANVKKNNDYALWFEAIKNGIVAQRYAESLSIYCKRENSISSGSKFKLIKHHYIMFRVALQKSKVMAVLCTINNLFFGVLKKLFYRRKI